MIIRSPFSDFPIPEMSLASFLLQRTQHLGSKPALIDASSGRTLTYAQIADAIPRVAAGLARRGFQPKDVVAFCCPNLPEFAIAFHAVAMLGGITTTINPLYTVHEMNWQLNDSRAKCVITVAPLLEKIREAAQGTEVTEIFVFGEAPGATPFAELIQGPSTPPAVHINPAEDVVALLYSSGTSGLPKAVMLTHRNLIANMISQGIAAHAFTEEDTAISVLPFFHVAGLAAVLEQALFKGMTLVVLPRFDLEHFLQAIQTHRVTFAPLVPPAVLALAKHPVVDRYDLSSLKWIVAGAAPLGEDVARACAARLNCPISQGYGMTEASGLTHFSMDAMERGRLASVGTALPGLEGQIVDLETGEPVGPGQTGELWLRGPQVMKGYLNQPDAVDEQGWYRTGDIGHTTEDGFVFIMDRVKELIKYKAFQVAPAELEAILNSHPAVAEAAVIPSPDLEAGEVPKAFVVQRSPVSPEELLAFVAERVAPHKKVRQLEFIDQIPKNAGGKILRRLLVERERGTKTSG